VTTVTAPNPVELASILGYAAVTFIVARAGIFRWLRELGPKGWRDFISCPLCTGFWVGFGMALARATFTHSLPWKFSSSRPFMSGLTGGFELGLICTGALTGAVALLYTAVLDALPEPPIQDRKTPKLPSLAVPDEAPTDPGGFSGPTKRIAERDIEEAVRRMGEKKG